ncbi:protein of unknown function [Pseudodesulfovibrio profundus]|uniref:Uncharacterized protein n=1 Tax=Pseudodesulfovibrio profundus TaxID=57320 RepID=A0A2C8F4Q3_9BACT|nr:hypothetical protein [Pseudodesulfovibrio profundus]SOB57590.1 protein of unknown function [Pseudodesulfovibrio profundus]
MTWLILIGILVFVGFVGFVGRATLGVISGSGGMDWAAQDDDDYVSVWDDDWMGNDDIYTLPIYSWMTCNIWHDPFADDFSWSSSSDDDWMWDNSDD